MKAGGGGKVARTVNLKTRCVCTVDHLNVSLKWLTSSIGLYFITGWLEIIQLLKPSNPIQGMINCEKVYPPLHNLIARGAMDKEKVLHEIKRDLKSPMVFRGLIFISMLILILIYQLFLK